MNLIQAMQIAKNISNLTGVPFDDIPLDKPIYYNKTVAAWCKEQPFMDAGYGIIAGHYVCNSFRKEVPIIELFDLVTKSGTDYIPF